MTIYKIIDHERISKFDFEKNQFGLIDVLIYPGEYYYVSKDKAQEKYKEIRDEKAKDPRIMAVCETPSSFIGYFGSIKSLEDINNTESVGVVLKEIEIKD